MSPSSPFVEWHNQGDAAMSSALNYPALVLNADFAPLRIWPLSTWDFKRTLQNVLKDRVTVVSEYDVRFRSSNQEYRPPSVVALKRYVKVPDRVPFNRINILMRDNFACQYCGGDLNLKEMTFDHVLPKSKGGGTSYTNIVSCCTLCNARKADRTDMRPRKAPQHPDPRELWKNRPEHMENLHKTWIDCLYWSGMIEQD